MNLPNYRIQNEQYFLYCLLYRKSKVQALVRSSAASKQYCRFAFIHSMFSQTSEGLHGKTSVYVVRLFYHEAKMFARKDIFARPSIARRAKHGRQSRKVLRSKTLCAYYIIIKNKIPCIFYGLIVNNL